MTKEQEIYKNMREIAKRRHTLKKSHGKWWVSYPTLLNAIEEAGYNENQSNTIIDRMIAKGYIHICRDINGHEFIGRGLIIDKWIN